MFSVTSAVTHSICFLRDFNVTLPLKTRNNGSLYVHAFLLPLGESPFTSPRAMFMSSRLTTYTVPKAEAFSLLGESSNGKVRRCC